MREDDRGAGGVARAGSWSFEALTIAWAPFDQGYSARVTVAWEGDDIAKSELTPENRELRFKSSDADGRTLAEGAVALRVGAPDRHLLTADLRVVEREFQGVIGEW